MQPAVYKTYRTELRHYIALYNIILYFIIILFYTYIIETVIFGCTFLTLFQNLSLCFKDIYSLRLQSFQAVRPNISACFHFFKQKQTLIEMLFFIMLLLLY